MGRFCKVFSLLLVLTILHACSTKNPNSPDPDTETPPTLPDLSMLNIAPPQNAPDDIQAMIFAANGLTTTVQNYMNNVTANQPAQVDDQWIWKYTENGLTITLTAAASADSVEWQLILDGVLDANTQFNNWTVMSGTSSLDGTGGSLVIYQINSTQIAGNATWQTDSQGTLALNLTIDASGDLEVQASANPNGDGSLTIAQNGVKIYEATWTASGGSWTSYDPSTGQEKDSGTW